MKTLTNNNKFRVKQKLRKEKKILAIFKKKTTVIIITLTFFIITICTPIISIITITLTIMTKITLKWMTTISNTGRTNWKITILTKPIISNLINKPIDNELKEYNNMIIFFLLFYILIKN